MPFRFDIAHFYLDFGYRQGLFQAVFALKRTGTLSAADHNALEGILAWFGKHLQTPTRLALSNRPGRQPQAICWFKDSAITHIAKIREYGLVLERNGLLVEQLRTTRPGYVIYQDRHQVAACPFADTPT